MHDLAQGARSDRGRGLRPTVHRYLDDPPSPAEIAETLEILGIGPWDLLRKREAELIGELGLDELPRDDANREEWIRLMSANPRLIERPVVLTGDGRGVLARPPERVDELIGRRRGRNWILVSFVIDAIHALTAFAFAGVDRRHRRLALTNGVTATAFAAADLHEARDAS